MILTASLLLQLTPHIPTDIPINFGYVFLQMNYKGRTILFDIKGRVHSFREPWVYDAKAWDKESGIRVKVNHFKNSKDAENAAFNQLILELKRKGLIKEETSDNGRLHTPLLARDRFRNDLFKFSKNRQLIPV